MAIKSIKLSEAVKVKGKTRKDAIDMSDEEIRKRALSDPDNPPLTEEQLNEFELADGKNGKKSKNNAIRGKE